MRPVPKVQIRRQRWKEAWSEGTEVPGCNKKGRWGEARGEACLWNQRATSVCSTVSWQPETLKIVEGRNKKMILLVHFRKRVLIWTLPPLSNARHGAKKSQSLQPLGVGHPQFFSRHVRRGAKKKVWGRALDTHGDWARGVSLGWT
jgi:hypothetical protein